jgi:hypothetical protein
MRMSLTLLGLICLWAVWAPSKTVDLTLAPRMAGRTLFIEGTTDLPDQAVIEWELRHEQLFQRRDIPIERMTNEGHAVVRGHRYGIAVDLSGWPAGSVEVWVAFQPLSYGTRQPAQISQIFGRNGERIEGNNVSVHPARMKRVELTQHVVLMRR